MGIRFSMWPADDFEFPLRDQAAAVGAPESKGE